MAADSAATALSVLFWYLCFFAVVNTIATLYRANIPRDQRRPACNDGGSAVLAIRLLWVAVLVALLIGGHYGLAALIGYSFLLGIAKRAENRRILGEGHKVWPVSRAVHRIVFAAAEGLAPIYDPLHRFLARPVGEVPLVAWLLIIPLFPIIVLLAIPMLPFWLFGLVRDRSRQKGLVKAAHAEGKLAWFAYSEPHQRARFMGEGGVLHGMGDALIERDWRRDMDGHWQRDKNEDLDAMIAGRFKLSNMKEDLPVIVLFHPDGRTRPVLLNRAYRQRFRDGGDLLGALEEAVRQRMQELRQKAV